MRKFNKVSISAYIFIEDEDDMMSFWNESFLEFMDSPESSAFDMNITARGVYDTRIYFEDSGEHIYEEALDIMCCIEWCKDYGIKMLKSGGYDYNEMP